MVCGSDAPATARLQGLADEKAKMPSPHFHRGFRGGRRPKALATAVPSRVRRPKLLLSIRPVFGETEPAFKKPFFEGVSEASVWIFTSASRSSGFKVIRFASAFPGASLQVAQI